MSLSIEENRRFQDRAECPHYYAAQDIAELHSLKRYSVEYKALNYLWCANGKWRILKRIFENPNIDRKTHIHEAEAFLFGKKNRNLLIDLFDQTKALCALYRQDKIRSNRSLAGDCCGRQRLLSGAA